MPQNADNISLIVIMLKQHGINRIVISPGGTNIALIRAVQDDDFFTCYSVVDERSAAYFAIGMYLQTGETIALCCTSAQATRNYIPGLTEAYYKRVPLLAITMQKHERFTGQEYMQAPNQSSLPVDSVKKSFVLPFVSDVNDQLHSIRVVNEAILELYRDGLGPVQLCVPWVDFPLGQIVPTVRKIERYPILGDFNLDLDRKKILLAIGEHRPFEHGLIESISRFANRFGAVVYANLLSNFHADCYVASNLLMLTMREEEFEKVAPDVLITIGGQTGDYPFYKMLSKPRFSHIEHWRVSCDGAVVDTYDKLTRIYQCSERDFFEAACGLPEVQSFDTTYIDTWKAMESARSTDVELPLSNARVAQSLADKLPSPCVVQLSILNSLRTWSLFKFDPMIEFYSNVGAFGIDGGMSTLIGQSFATEDPCFMVIGDLAFLYDINSLSIRGIAGNVRVLLINNNGGFEFKIDTGHNPDVDRYIAASDHFKTASGWASDCGFRYLSASDSEEFETAADVFVAPSDRPILLEVFVSDDNEFDAYSHILERNQTFSFSHTIKRGIKKSLRSLQTNDSPLRQGHR